MSEGWTVGDTKPDLTGTCMDGDAPTPITGAVLKVHVRKPSGEVLPDKTATEVDGPAGKWSATWAPGDLDEAGNWEAEVEVTFSGGGVQTFPADSFPVRPQIA